MRRQIGRLKKQKPVQIIGGLRRINRGCKKASFRVVSCGVLAHSMHTLFLRHFCLGSSSQQSSCQLWVPCEHGPSPIFRACCTHLDLCKSCSPSETYVQLKHLCSVQKLLFFMRELLFFTDKIRFFRPCLPLHLFGRKTVMSVLFAESNESRTTLLNTCAT